MGAGQSQCEDSQSQGWEGGARDAASREEVDGAAFNLPAEFTKKYTALSVVGCGGFGRVYKARDVKTKVVYAVKQVQLSDSNRQEVQLQAQIDDTHVVKVLDTITAPVCGQLFIVMEFCEGGNLLQWVKRNRKHDMLNELVILQMLQEICTAVYSCHQKSIIHRDLKPENILLDSKRRIKLADFGVARELNRASLAKSFCGSPPYMAPELFLSYLSRSASPSTGAVVGYDAKCDVWSIGCILWDMANCKNKFVHQLKSNVGLNVAQATSDSLGAAEIEELIEDDVPAEYVLTKKLLRLMLKRNAQQRISLSEVLQSAELRTALENPMGGHWSDIYDRLEK